MKKKALPQVVLRPIQARVDPLSGAGFHTQCPKSGTLRNIAECIFCKHYEGLWVEEDEDTRLRCTHPQPPCQPNGLPWLAPETY